MSEEFLDKQYSASFVLNAKIIGVIYICYKYKFPLSFMLSFYEMYGDASIFALKALSCTKKTKISDNEMIKIIDESRKLYLQIQKGISDNIKRKQIQLGYLKNVEMPEEPKLNLEGFSMEFVHFVEDYLLKNIEDIYAHEVKLKMGSEDLYGEMV